MIDFKQIYEAASDVDPSIRRSDSFKRIPYSIGQLGDIPAILGQKINLVHRLRLVKKPNFNPDGLQPKWSLKMKPNTCIARLGNGLEYGVKSEKISFFEDGMACVELDIDEVFIDKVIAFMDIKQNIGQYDDELKSVKRAASDEFEKTNAFDADDIYKVKGRSKTSQRNQQQAIAKKRAGWEKNKSHAVQVAVQNYNQERNRKIIETCGFDEDVIRILLNGSLTDDGRFFWYPTVLDLCRMFQSITIIPTDLAVVVNDNDQNNPQDDKQFVKDILFESWEEVTDGWSAFDDIRDSKHKNTSDIYMPFPIAKPKRWTELKKMASAKDIPLKDYKGIRHERTHDNVYHTISLEGLKTTIGDLGKIFCSIDKMSGPYETCKCIIMKNGIVMLYTSDGDRLITAMILPPETLIKIIKYSEHFTHQSQRPGIPVWLLHTCAKNVPIMPGTDDTYAFVSTPGTRRYIV